MAVVSNFCALSDGKELRLLLYKECEAGKPFGSVEVAIRTKAVGEPGEGTYKGRSAVTVHDMEGDTRANSSVPPSTAPSPASRIGRAARRSKGEVAFPRAVYCRLDICVIAFVSNRSA